MKNNCKYIWMGLGLWVCSFTGLAANPEPPVEKKEEKPEVEITETEVKLPGVTVDRATKEVRIDAKVCLDSGMLEYVVCRPDTFDHESIFTSEAKPEFVHAALLLCGLRPTPQRRGMGALWAEQAMNNKQSRVKIEVEWEQEGKKKRVNLTSMISDRQDDFEEFESPEEDEKEKEPLVQDAWLFAGSFVHVNEETGKKLYAANSSGILVGILQDFTAVIQYGIDSGDPYKGKHLGLEINEENVPKLGTKVKLVFSLHDGLGKKEVPKKAEKKK